MAFAPVDSQFISRAVPPSPQPSGPLRPLVPAIPRNRLPYPSRQIAGKYMFRPLPRWSRAHGPAPQRIRKGMLARLRRIPTGFPCSARDEPGHKTCILLSGQKKKPHRQTFCRRDRLFSHPAFLQPISGPRFGAHTWSVFWLAHFGGFLRQRLHPAFSGFPNDRIAPLRVRTFAHTATGIAPGFHRIPSSPHLQIADA